MDRQTNELSATTYARLTQLGACLPYKQKAMGSSPVSRIMQNVEVTSHPHMVTAQGSIPCSATISCSSVGRATGC